MKKIVITLGQDTPAYVNYAMEVSNDATDEQIVGLVKESAVKRAEDLVFEPCWDWVGLRVVEIADQDGHVIANDIPINASSEDLGIVARNVLSGHVGPLALLQEAERQGVKVDPVFAVNFTAFATQSMAKYFVCPDQDKSVGRRTVFASTPLNPTQKRVADLYCGGEYNYVTTVEDVDKVGDGLFAFMIHEAHDVPDLKEFVESLDAALDQVDEVRRAMQEDIENLSCQSAKLRQH